MYTYNNNYICQECLKEHFPSEIEQTKWIPLEEANYGDSFVKKVQSTLARADPKRNDNSNERKIAGRQAEKMMNKYNLKKVICEWCYK